MRLEQQLAELRGNILRDTSSLFEGERDSLWSDETLLSYIGDAERRFARQTLILRDADTPAVTRIVLATGVSRYMLHTSVQAVISAQYDEDVYDLSRVGRALIASTIPYDEPFFDPSTAATWTPGRPRAYSTDELLTYQQRSRTALIVYPEPTSAQNGLLLRLRVARLPLCGYTTSDLAKESEIPEDYQFDVLSWAAYRALQNQDADAGQPTPADKHRQRFEDVVKEAKVDAQRRTFAPLRWQFGGNGFSYTR